MLPNDYWNTNCISIYSKNTVYTEEMNENLIKIQILAPPPTQYIFF